MQVLQANCVPLPLSSLQKLTGVIVNYVVEHIPAINTVQDKFNQVLALRK